MSYILSLSITTSSFQSIEQVNLNCDDTVLVKNESVTQAILQLGQLGKKDLGDIIKNQASSIATIAINRGTHTDRRLNPLASGVFLSSNLFLAPLSPFAQENLKKGEWFALVGREQVRMRLLTQDSNADFALFYLDHCAAMMIDKMHLSYPKLDIENATSDDHIMMHHSERGEKQVTVAPNEVLQSSIMEHGAVILNKNGDFVAVHSRKANDNAEPFVYTLLSHPEVNRFTKLDKDGYLIFSKSHKHDSKRQTVIAQDALSQDPKMIKKDHSAKKQLFKEAEGELEQHGKRIHKHDSRKEVIVAQEALSQSAKTMQSETSAKKELPEATEGEFERYGETIHYYEERKPGGGRRGLGCYIVGEEDSNHSYRFSPNPHKTSYNSNQGKLYKSAATALRDAEDEEIFPNEFEFKCFSTPFSATLQNEERRESGSENEFKSCR